MKIKINITTEMEMQIRIRTALRPSPPARCHAESVLLDATRAGAPARHQPTGPAKGSGARTHPVQTCGTVK